MAFWSRPGLARCSSEPGLFCDAQLQAAWPSALTRCSPTDGDETLYNASAAITSCHYAVAETGSVVVATGPQRWRSLSVIPPVHVVVIRVAQILADLVDLFDALSHEPLSANVVLITGPSKTADIEGVLVTGVHGPGQVWACVVDD